jgi:PDZ domain-containing protein
VDGHGDESLGSTGWKRWYWALVVLAVLILAAGIASLISIPYYAITPGTAQSVERLIGIPSRDSHPHGGQVLLVDVELTPLRAIEWPWFELDPNAQIVSSQSLLGPVNAAQYQIQGQLDMSNAQQAATVVALRRLGHHVSVRNSGALVYSLFPGSPAARALAVGDVVVGIEGHAVTDEAQVAKWLRRAHPGQRIALTVRTYPSRKTQHVSVQPSEWRVQGKGNNATLVCPIWGTDTRLPLYRAKGSASGAPSGPTKCVGVELEQDYVVGKLPFRVDLSSEGIIGPSAGLAFTLGLMERLDPYDLTGGHKVAATGTMDIYGDVGDVGGVAQKTVAVRNSGASVFFVPPQEYKVALAHAGNSLKVYAVSSVDQAIHILVTKYGGRLPAAAGSH